jgi:hypothetical protein
MEVTRPKMKIRHLHYDSNPLAMLYQQAERDRDKDRERGRGRERERLNAYPSRQQTTMDRFTTQSKCELCAEDAMPQRNLCQHCLSQPGESLILLMQRLNLTKEREKVLERHCQETCVHFHQESMLFAKNEMIGPNACESIECSHFHERSRLVMRIEDFMIATHDIQNM